LVDCLAEQSKSVDVATVARPLAIRGIDAGVLASPLRPARFSALAVTSWA